MALTFRNYRFRVERGGQAREFELYIPPTAAHRRMAEEAHKRGAVPMTPNAVMGRRIDQPIVPRAGGQAVVMPRDEREARSGKPVFLFDHRPGRPPLLVVGGGTRHIEQLQERVERERADGSDRMARPPTRQAAWQQLWHDLRAAAADRAVGRTRFSMMPRKPRKW